MNLNDQFNYLNVKNNPGITSNNNNNTSRFLIDSLLSRNTEPGANTDAALTTAFLHQQMINKMYSNNDHLLQILNQNILSAFTKTNANNFLKVRQIKLLIFQFF